MKLKETWTTVSRTCESCGCEFRTRPDFARKGISRYCSIGCLNKGRVNKPLGEVFWLKVDKSGSCWIWKGSKDAKGYGTLQHQGVRYQAHRAAYILACGELPDGLLVCNRCDNPPCVNPGHLFLGTHADNHADRNAKGRQASGDRNGARAHPERIPRGEDAKNSRLTPTIVADIRQRYKDGSTIPAIGRQLGYPRSTIWSVVTRVSWKHIP